MFLISSRGVWASAELCSRVTTTGPEGTAWSCVRAGPGAVTCCPKPWWLWNRERHQAAIGFGFWVVHCETRSWTLQSLWAPSNLGYSVILWRLFLTYKLCHWKFSLNRHMPSIMRSVLEYSLIGVSVLPAPPALHGTPKNIWSWRKKPAKPPFSHLLFLSFSYLGSWSLHSQCLLMPVVVQDGDLKSLQNPCTHLPFDNVAFYF